MNPDDWRFEQHAYAESRCNIQERLHSIIPKVFVLKRSKLLNEGSPWMGVWEPLRGMIVGPQAHKNRVLLAHTTEGCPILCESMWQMPILQQCHKAAIKAIHPNERPMAFRLIGIGYHGTLSNSNATTHKTLPNPKMRSINNNLTCLWTSGWATGAFTQRLNIRGVLPLFGDMKGQSQWSPTLSPQGRGILDLFLPILRSMFVLRVINLWNRRTC